eukprot:scaffold10752_cov196-Ochromonas_danica.AAC.2
MDVVGGVFEWSGGVECVGGVLRVFAVCVGMDVFKRGWSGGGKEFYLSSAEEKHEASFLQFKHSGDADGQGKQSTMAGREELGVKVAVEKSNKQNRSKLDWRAVLAMKVCIAVVNISIVLV